MTGDFNMPLTIAQISTVFASENKTISGNFVTGSTSPVPIHQRDWEEEGHWERGVISGTSSIINTVTAGSSSSIEPHH